MANPITAPPLTGTTAQQYATNPAVKKFLDAMAQSHQATFTAAKSPTINPQGGVGTQTYGPAPGPYSLVQPFANFNPGTMGQQVDQGWDVSSGQAGTPVLAAAPGTIEWASNPGGFGQEYPVLDLTTPYQGQNAIYYGHVDPTVPAGTKVTAGEPIALTDNPAPDSNATSAGWLEEGFWGPNGPVGNGAAMKAALSGGSTENSAGLIQQLNQIANDPALQANLSGQQSLIGQQGYNTDVNKLLLDNAQKQLGFANQSVANQNQIRNVQAQQLQQSIGNTEQQQQYQEGQYGLSQAGLQQQQAQLESQTQQGLFNQESADVAGGTLITPEHARQLNNVMQRYQFGTEGINQQVAGSRLGQQQEYLGYLQNLANQLYGQKEFNLGYNDQLLALQRAAQAYDYQTKLANLSTGYQNSQIDLAGQMAAVQAGQIGSTPINQTISAILGLGG